MSLVKNSKTFKKFNEFLRLTPGITTIFTVYASVFFLTHLVGCFWFLLAKLYDFPEDSWVRQEFDGWVGDFGEEPTFNVTRFDYNEDSNVGLWYSMSLYWASQTLLTVGFGDISGKNLPERIFCICWIVFAVTFYSYAIGNITNVVSSMDIATE